jgi:hypothetical protein
VADALPPANQLAPVRRIGAARERSSTSLLGALLQALHRRATNGSREVDLSLRWPIRGLYDSLLSSLRWARSCFRRIDCLPRNLIVEEALNLVANFMNAQATPILLLISLYDCDRAHQSLSSDCFACVKHVIARDRND